MLWLGLNTQEPWISVHNTTHSRERGMKVNRQGEKSEGALQSELRPRDVNGARGERDTDKESDGDRRVKRCRQAEIKKSETMEKGEESGDTPAM